jgi:hypothetical protein
MAMFLLIFSNFFFHLAVWQYVSRFSHFPLLHIYGKTPEKVPFQFFSPPNAKNWPGHREIPQKAIRNNAGMVPREDLEESVVRTGRDFPAGGNPCLSKGLTCDQAAPLFKFENNWENSRIFPLLAKTY